MKYFSYSCKKWVKYIGIFTSLTFPCTFPPRFYQYGTFGGGLFYPHPRHQYTKTLLWRAHKPHGTFPYYNSIPQETHFTNKKMLRKSRSITKNTRAPRTLKPQQARLLIRRFHILIKNKATIIRHLGREEHNLSESNYKEVLGQRFSDEYQNFKLSKQLEQFLVDGSVLKQELCLMLARIDAEIDQRGGLHVYQMASTVGQDEQRGGDSLKRLVTWFKELGRVAQDLLEIGCLSSHNAILTSGSFGHIQRIDLNSQNPQILQQDFMQRPLPALDKERFDVISCLLVLNFVPTPAQRGEMLKRMTQFLRKPATGVSSLFLVLPLPCVSNSRYFDAAVLAEIMQSLGFSEVRYYEAKKVAYWLYDWTGLPTTRKKFKKREIHSGSKRNNFYVEIPMWNSLKFFRLVRPEKLTGSYRIVALKGVPRNSDTALLCKLGQTNFLNIEGTSALTRLLSHPIPLHILIAIPE